MNIQEYISSGIIESYVLGIASEKEQAEFELLAEKYPELKAARIHFEIAMEEKALDNAVPPPAFLKTKIFDAIHQEAAVATASKIVSIQRPAKVRKTSTMRWIAAASVLVVLACGYLLYTLNNRNEELREQMAKSKEAIDKLDAKARMMEEEIVRQNAKQKQINVVTPTQKIPPSINVFWDSTNANVYLIVKDLAILPTDQMYELWAVTKGETKSLGLFDAPTEGDNKLIIKMNNVQDADSFTLTIRKGVARKEE